MLLGKIKFPRAEGMTLSISAQDPSRASATLGFDGKCTGGGVGEYAYVTKMKRELLAREGVDVDALDALASEGVRYIGSRTTKIYCFPTCRDARRIREENRVPFHGAGEAQQKGFRPCQRCRPVAAA